MTPEQAKAFKDLKSLFESITPTDEERLAIRPAYRKVKENFVKRWRETENGSTINVLLDLSNVPESIRDAVQVLFNSL